MNIIKIKSMRQKTLRNIVKIDKHVSYENCFFVMQINFTATSKAQSYKLYILNISTKQFNH